MADLIAKDYWNQRYAAGMDSGYGSRGEQLIKKLTWLMDLKVKSIVEIGCGDFYFGSHLLEHYPKAKYIGQDISDVIITKNKALYPKYKFTTDSNVITKPADLLLCVDVLYHILDRNEYDAMLSSLFHNYTKYLALTAYEYDRDDLDTHVRVYKFDYRKFGKPLIREVIEENGKLYFYLFKR